jgi:hypothetical protein
VLLPLKVSNYFQGFWESIPIFGMIKHRESISTHSIKIRKPFDLRVFMILTCLKIVRILRGFSLKALESRVVYRHNINF